MIGDSLLIFPWVSNILLSMDTKTFLKISGERIRAVRKSHKMSQEKLAELSGLHPTYISDIENGKSNASIYSFYSIADALNIPLSELLNISSNKASRKTDAELLALLSLVKGLDKKRQRIFLSAAKGLISGIEET